MKKKGDKKNKGGSYLHETSGLECVARLKQSVHDAMLRHGRYLRVAAPSSTACCISIIGRTSRPIKKAHAAGQIQVGKEGTE